MLVERLKDETKSLEGIGLYCRRDYVKPRLSAGDFVVIYASGATKGIVGAFEVEGVTTAAPGSIWRKHNGGSGLEKVEFDRYFEGAEVAHAIRIGKVWQLPSPVLLGTLRKRRSGFRPPQSYHYWKLGDLLRMGGDVFASRIKAPRAAERESGN